MRNRESITAIIILIMILSCGTTKQNTVLRKVPRSKREALMVLNFRNATLKKNAENFQPWEFGIASMMMTDLESIGMFNIISRERIKDILKEQEFQMTGTVDPGKAVKVGKLAAAKYILSGTFMEMNGNLRIEAQVFSVERGTQLGAASETGRTDNFFDIEKKLVVKVSRYLNAVLTESEVSRISTNIETKSVNASLNNYSGEAAVIESEDLKAKGKKLAAKKLLEKARSSFKQALKQDPDYERAKKNLAKITLAIPVTL